MLFVAVVQFGHSFPLSAFRLRSIQEEGVMSFFHNAGPMQYLLMREKNGKKNPACILWHFENLRKNFSLLPIVRTDAEVI